MFHVKHWHIKYGELVDVLLDRNQRTNLTGVRDRGDVLVKHIEDSLVAVDHIKNNHPNARRLLDLGTGAGFPGLIIAKECTELTATLLDATSKKITFVNEAILLLNLSNAEGVADRVEHFAVKHNNVFDLVIARSVARLDTLLEYASPLLANGGHLLAMKRFDSREELGVGENIAPMLGFDVATIHPYTLSGQNRAIFSFKKSSNASITLPRKIGDALKNPLKRRS